MPTVKIDDKEYDLDSLSAEAKAQLNNIRFVEQELARLQATANVLQTARAAYVNALRSHLPVLGEAGQVAGMVSIGDLVKETISSQQFIISELERYITG